MKWFFPSWNGDFRLEPTGDDNKTCVLTVKEPTPSECTAIHDFLKRAKKRLWIDREVCDDRSSQIREGRGIDVTIEASLSQVGPVLLGFVKPKGRTLTTLKYEDGKLEACEVIDPKKLDPGEKPVRPNTPKPTAAVSTARPTPCCPSCIPGSIEPASEVLQSFLTPEEHEEWAAERTITFTGGYSGFRYLLAHRQSRLAVKMTRICYDLDNDHILHFHDWSVPPEEEVLAALLILKHRESWLRNEATVLNLHSPRFKNPFGDGMDGVQDSSITAGIGVILRNFGGPRA